VNDKKIRDKKITGPAIGILSRPGDHVPDRYFLVHHILVSFPQRPKDLRGTRATLFTLRLCVIRYFAGLTVYELLRIKTHAKTQRRKELYRIDHFTKSRETLTCGFANRMGEHIGASSAPAAGKAGRGTFVEVFIPSVPLVRLRNLMQHPFGGGR
jgi:hypothetical protein